MPAAAGGTPADTRPVLVLGGSQETYNAVGPWLTLIYTDALGRLGYRLDYRPYPAKRSSVMSDTGGADGEMHRAAGYALQHPEMVQVPVSHFSFNFVAYATRPLELRGGWQAFKDTPLRVEYRSGVYRAEQHLRQLVPAGRLSTANNSLLGLRKLQVGRSDVYIDVDVLIEPLLAQEEFRRSGIRKVALIETTDMYVHLNKRHAGLAVKLGQVLADMKKEGLIEKYRVQAGVAKY
ncbi:hypothetical protein GCM10027277_15690 [Pseudoduganella ginsengisoli]